MSTVKKSQAMMPAAWRLRNSLQESPDRLGAGSIPSERRIDHSVLGAIAIPRCLKLSLDPPVAPGRVVLGEADHQLRTSACVGGRPWRRGYVQRRAHERAVPSKDRLGTDEK